MAPFLEKAQMASVSSESMADISQRKENAPGIKTYYGLHSVEYSGFREKKGIWGTWTIQEVKGGFHIWPIGEGTTIEHLREEAVEEFPLKIASIVHANSALKTANSPEISI